MLASFHVSVCLTLGKDLGKDHAVLRKSESYVMKLFPVRTRCAVSFGLYKCRQHGERLDISWNSN